MSTTDSNVVARTPHAHEEGKQPMSLEDIIDFYGDIVVTFENGMVTSILISSTKEVEYGYTWGKETHIIYRPFDGMNNEVQLFKCSREKTRTLVCG